MLSASMLISSSLGLGLGLGLIVFGFGLEFNEFKYRLANKS